MAELTLTQRAELQENSRFRSRLAAAVQKTANFWNDYATDTLQKYNVAVKKRKEYARQVSSNPGLPSGGYVSYFVSKYNTDIAVTSNLESDSPFDVNTNQLGDMQLTDSSTSTITFDYFAGVKTGDETTQILL